VEDLGAAPDVEEAVRLPVQVRELRDDVADEGGVLTHLFDLMFQREVLLPLRGDGELVVAPEDLVQVEALEAALDAVGDGDVHAGAEPDRLLAVLREEVFEGREPPVPELRAHERLFAAWLRVAVPG